MIRSCLQFNPGKRPTIEQLLKHPYVAQFSSPEEEIRCNRVIQISIDDNQKFGIKKYREALYQDIARKKQEQRKKW